MSFFKKLNFMLRFNLYFVFNLRKQNKCFRNFDTPLILNPSQELVTELPPKKIWIYWQGNECNLVQTCVEKIKLFNPKFELYFLNQDSIKKYSQIDYDNYSQLTPQLKSDLIRLDLLTTYGGYWLDASILTFENLDWIQELITNHKTNSFGYYRRKNTIIPSYPVIETWLLATPPNQDFFKAWKNELIHVIERTPKAYIKHLKESLLDAQDYFQKIGRLEYLCAYVAAQRVMRNHLPSMTLINCDQNAFLLQTQFQWDKYKVLHALAIDKKPETMPKLIKLVGKERNLINKYYIKKRFKEDSLLDEL